jgi:N-acetylglucosamine-6-phosphate deacetylase
LLESLWYDLPANYYLLSLTFLVSQQMGKITHNIPRLTKDVQMSTTNSAMLIFVTGQLKIGDEANFLLFSQVFQLVATGPGQYYVHNEIFRLIYA